MGNKKKSGRLFVVSKFCFYCDLLTVGFLILHNCFSVFVCIEGLNRLTVVVEGLTNSK